MLQDKVFQVALLISVFTHGVFIAHAPLTNFLSRDKKEKRFDVTYIKVSPKLKEIEKPDLKKDTRPLNLSAKVIAQNVPPPFLNKDEIFKQRQDSVSENPALSKKPNFAKPDIIAVKKKISLPPVDIDKINNPSYISYYQIVREKIRRSAYQNYNSSETGEVYISFLVSRDGYLRDARLIEDKSSHSSYLKQTALSSIKEAAPFPSFPKELDYPHLSFNVIISFELE